MRVVFVSNYLNHHQIPFSNAMYQELKGKYQFIQTMEMEEERINMGYALDENQYPYLLKSYEKMDTCIKSIEKSDVVIIGSAPNSFLKNHGGLTFRYSERTYKRGQWRAFSPRGIYHMHKAHAHAQKRNMYMLCASAYTPCDLNIFHYYPNRMLKWGYFPEQYKNDMDSIFSGKRKEKLQILWCGRFVSWKHPEIVLELAQWLQKKDISVEILMIGSGELRSKCEEEIKRKKLGAIVKIIGPFTPEKVRKSMLESHIFVATSDYGEGWGAVLNEAMNSACAVIASHAMGATPYLIQHGKNGLVYKSGDKKGFFRQVEYVIKNRDRAELLGRKAYETITEIWNADQAAKAFIRFAKGVLEEHKEHYADFGPCSRAPVIAEGRMYQKLVKGKI